MSLKDKVAIVTGVASGFGAEIGSAALATEADDSRRADIDRLVTAFIAEFAVPVIVVNNAGFTHRNQPLLDADEVLLDKLFAVNVKLIFHMVNAGVPHMRRRGSGVVLNIGSTAGMRPRPGLTWRNGSKEAVNLLSKSLAIELGKDGIRVNLICPVKGETAMLADFMGAPDTPENRACFVSIIPLGASFAAIGCGASDALFSQRRSQVHHWGRVSS